jgi:type IV pilus assembly protein PilV
MESITMPISNQRGDVRGFALIEVLIAVLVLAVGILGAGAMQTIGLQSNQGAYLRSQAMILAGDMIDRMRSNRAARATYIGTDTNAIGVATLPACLVAANGCSSGDMATAHIQEWADIIERSGVLPGARGVIAAGAGDDVQVTITWGEVDWNAGDRDDVQQTYSITAAINPGDH